MTSNAPYWLSSWNFFRGESTVMQISSVILIFLLLSDSRGGLFEGAALTLEES